MEILLLLLQADLCHIYSQFVPQLMVYGHKGDASPTKLALIVGLCVSLPPSIPPILLSLSK